MWCVQGRRKMCVVLVRKPEGKNFGGVSADGGIILGWMFEQRWEGMD
jgi:hypothetical protein